MNPELQIALKILLANTYIAYFKAHTYHWNVEGMLFKQFHDFFGDLYEDLFDSIDDIAERIRTIDAYAPISLIDVLKFSTIQEDATKPSSTKDMVSNLIGACNEVMNSLNKSLQIAEQINNQGLVDYLGGRHDVMSKHLWMLRSTLASNEG